VLSNHLLEIVIAASGFAYGVVVLDKSSNDSVTIGPSWTRGLAIHPVGTSSEVIRYGVRLPDTFRPFSCRRILIALLLSFSSHITVTLLASLASFLAALITLIAFAIDIALFAFVKNQFGTLNNSDFVTNTAPAFWMTFVSLVLLVLAGFTVCCGRRRQTRLDSAEPGPYRARFGNLWSRFRRTPKY
jgi:hypothetical protein